MSETFGLHIINIKDFMISSFFNMTIRFPYLQNKTMDTLQAYQCRTLKRVDLERRWQRKVKEIGKCPIDILLGLTYCSFIHSDRNECLIFVREYDVIPAVIGKL